MAAPFSYGSIMGNFFVIIDRICSPISIGSCYAPMVRQQLLRMKRVITEASSPS